MNYKAHTVFASAAYSGKTLILSCSIKKKRGDIDPNPTVSYHLSSESAMKQILVHKIAAKNLGMKFKICVFGKFRDEIRWYRLRQKSDQNNAEARRQNILDFIFLGHNAKQAFRKMMKMRYSYGYAESIDPYEQRKRKNSKKSVLSPESNGIPDTSNQEERQLVRDSERAAAKRYPGFFHP